MKVIPEILAITIAFFSLTSGALAAPLVIDTFATAQSTTGVVDGAGILGGERDASINGGNVLNIGSGVAQFSLPNDQAGAFIILQWDGNDNNTTVSYQLNADFTGGSGNDRFYLGVSAVTGTVAVRIYVAESEEVFALLNFEISQTGVVEIPFDTLAGSVPLPNFGAIQHLALRMIMDPGESITVNNFSTGTGPLVFEDGFEAP
jgi:hypothetical protein